MGLCSHCTISVQFFATVPNPKGNSHRNFSLFSARPETAAGLDYQPLLTRLALHKDIIWQAGRLVHGQMLWEHCRGEVATSWVNGTISRALLRQDCRLANTLCNNTHREVRYHLLVGPGEVTLNHFADCAADYENIHIGRSQTRCARTLIEREG